MRLVNSLICFQAVLEALEVRLEMTAHVLQIDEGGTFEVHRTLLGGYHMLPTMAYDSDIVGSHQRMVVIFVSC